MAVDHVGVHATHCCVIHGCKYGDEDCPVVNKEVKQEYLCEQCDDEYGSKKYTFDDIEEVYNSPFDQHEPYTILEKLHLIEVNKNIYNIHYCRAGVGICFYYPRKVTTDGNWKEGLSTQTFYKDFEACITVEYKIMLEEINEDELVDGQQ